MIANFLNWFDSYFETIDQICGWIMVVVVMLFIIFGVDDWIERKLK